MLQAQVNYWTLMENQRHNLASEKLGVDTLVEAIRHNKESESLGWENLYESKRHNVQTEQLGFLNYDESKRHNLSTEKLGYLNYKESQRHNLATEGETNRHNFITEHQTDVNLAEQERSHLANEAIGWANAAAAKTQAAAAWRNANTQEIGAQLRQNELNFAQTKWGEEYELRTTANDIAQQQANTAWWNAMNNIQGTNVSQQNADTNAQNAATAYYNAETQRWEFYLDTGKAISSEARGWYDSITSNENNKEKNFLGFFSSIVKGAR